MPTKQISEDAPAKVNLCLHVTGRKPDGYHLLDSLVVFAGVGDRVGAGPGDGLALSVSGPEAPALLPEADNLVLRAARAMGVAGARLTLWKALPVSSGIGGGSADAAATLRALARMTGKPVPDDAGVLALGADVPVCLAGRAARMSGVGEALADLPPLPPLWLVLVNPRVAVSTPQVFARLDSRENPAVPGMPAEGWPTAVALADWLVRNTRNDLEPPARQIAPVLADVDAALRATKGCLLARMSGSGATCFGLYASPGEAGQAAKDLQAARPGWWVAAAPVLT